MNFKQENEVFMMKLSFSFGPSNWLQLGLKILGSELTEAENSPSRRLIDMKTCVVELEFKGRMENMVRRLCDILNYK